MAIELGVFVPVFNGGELLIETIESCLASPFPQARRQLIVMDNCSTDGACEEAVRRFGSRLEVIRNERNLGRVENWNRCVETAERRGFEFFQFLFVGDRWVSGSALAETLDRMRACNAVLALAAYEIRDESCRLVRLARRFTLPDRFLEIGGAHFLDTVISKGTIPVAPLQADLFRVVPGAGLRFDPAVPTTTDMEATVEFLWRTGGGVLLSSVPFMAWRRHPNRFFLTQNLTKFIEADTAQLRRLSAQTARAVNWPVANALLVLKHALGIWLFVPPARRFREGAALIRHLRKRGGGFSLLTLVRYAVERAILKRSLLRFAAGPRVNQLS